jgi:glycosyl transferase family 2
MLDPVRDASPVELSVVMPCLNEAETLGTCIEKARSAIDEMGIAAEVVIADNGSTDDSRRIAAAAGARVVPVDAPRIRLRRGAEPSPAERCVPSVALASGGVRPHRHRGRGLRNPLRHHRCSRQRRQGADRERPQRLRGERLDSDESRKGRGRGGEARVAASRVGPRLAPRSLAGAECPKLGRPAGTGLRNPASPVMAKMRLTWPEGPQTRSRRPLLVISL